MIELTLEYQNKLASHLLLTCVFLGGFSIAVLANLLISNSTHRLHNVLLKISSVSSGSFLITVFALSKIIMMTTDGYPREIDQFDLRIAGTIATLAYILGICSLTCIIGLSGWIKSRPAGWFTTSVAIIAIIMIFYFI